MGEWGNSVREEVSVSEGETMCKYCEGEACRVSGSEWRGRQCASIVREGERG